MLVDPVNEASAPSFSFKQVNDLVTTGGAAFQKLGVLPGDCVSVFSENSHKWLIAEQSVMKAGAYNAVRGSSAPTEELKYIYDNSKSVGAVVESPALLEQLCTEGGLKSEAGTPKFIIVLYSKGQTSEQLQTIVQATNPETKVLTYEDFLTMSDKESFNSEFVPKNSDSLATLVYTSGTTSKPKGVMLSHKNLLYQVWVRF